MTANTNAQTVQMGAVAYGPDYAAGVSLFVGSDAWNHAPVIGSCVYETPYWTARELPDGRVLVISDGQYSASSGLRLFPDRGAYQCWRALREASDREPGERPSEARRRSARVEEAMRERGYGWLIDWMRQPAACLPPARIPV